jgi:hypothetical protein
VVSVAFSSSDFDSSVFDSVGFASLLAQKYEHARSGKEAGQFRSFQLAADRDE